jgi:hypothetical protein
MMSCSAGRVFEGRAAEFHHRSHLDSEKFVPENWSNNDEEGALPASS